VAIETEPACSRDAEDSPEHGLQRLDSQVSGSRFTPRAAATNYWPGSPCYDSPAPPAPAASVGDLHLESAVGDEELELAATPETIRRSLEDFGKACVAEICSDRLCQLEEPGVAREFSEEEPQPSHPAVALDSRGEEVVLRPRLLHIQQWQQEALESIMLARHHEATERFGMSDGDPDRAPACPAPPPPRLLLGASMRGTRPLQSRQAIAEVPDDSSSSARENSSSSAREDRCSGFAAALPLSALERVGPEALQTPAQQRGIGLRRTAPMMEGPGSPLVGRGSAVGSCVRPPRRGGTGQRGSLGACGDSVWSRWCGTGHPALHGTVDLHEEPDGDAGTASRGLRIGRRPAPPGTPPPAAPPDTSPMGPGLAQRGFTVEWCSSPGKPAVQSPMLATCCRPMPSEMPSATVEAQGVLSPVSTLSPSPCRARSTLQSPTDEELLPQLGEPTTLRSRGTRCAISI